MFTILHMLRLRFYHIHTSEFFLPIARCAEGHLSSPEVHLK